MQPGHGQRRILQCAYKATSKATLKSVTGHSALDRSYDATQSLTDHRIVVTLRPAESARLPTTYAPARAMSTSRLMHVSSSMGQNRSYALTPMVDSLVRTSAEL
ncbi:hypothetical protein C8Q77DRAFT_620422 [Trametes polyzona]|nr:hypothetical protein C8Q77DRAFT_620422 [Trametes polyzona]